MEGRSSSAVDVGGQPGPSGNRIVQELINVPSCSTAFWVSFASNPSVDPRNHLKQSWPRYIGPSGQIVVFGNATGTGPSYVAPVAIADAYSGPCSP